MIKLDKADRRILFELDKNSRQHISILSRKLRLGRDLVSYRIKRLQDRGIVKRFTALIDPYRLGMSIHKVYLRLENRTSRKVAFVNHLKKHKSVYWIAECDGAWDLIFTLIAGSTQEFYSIRAEILSSFNELIIDSSSATIVDIDMCYKHFFHSNNPGYFFIGNEKVDKSIDTIDTTILTTLTENSRIDIKELAESANSTPTVIRHRIKQLEELEVIVGYRTDVCLESLEMTFFKAQLFLNSYCVNVEQSIREYVHKHPHITYFIRQVGPSAIELEIDANDYYHYNDILADLRKSFCGQVKSIETILVRREEYKRVL